MGRFSAAKTTQGTDAKLQTAHNQLIDLLDKGYMTEAIIGDKKVKIEISPSVGLKVTVDNVPVMSIDSNGYLMVNRISDPDDPKIWLQFANEIDPNWAGIQFVDNSHWSTLKLAWLSILETASAGFAFIDALNQIRIAINPKNASLDPEGGIYMYDSAGYRKFTINDNAVEIRTSPLDFYDSRYSTTEYTASIRIGTYKNFKFCDWWGIARINIVPETTAGAGDGGIYFNNRNGTEVFAIYDTRAYATGYLVSEKDLYVGTYTAGIPDLPHAAIKSTGYIQAGSAAYPENMIAAAHTVYSDVNIKENLQPYDKDSAYNLIKELPVYSFNYINDEFKRFHIGTTYQDAPKEIAFTDIDEDILAVDTGNALFLAISSIQKLQEKVEALETKIKDLETRLDASV